MIVFRPIGLNEYYQYEKVKFKKISAELIAQGWVVISILLLILGYKLLEVLKELAKELIKMLKDE